MAAHRLGLFFCAAIVSGIGCNGASGSDVPGSTPIDPAAGTATGTGAGTGTGTDGCVPILGCGTHDLSTLNLDVVLGSSDGLRLPRDLAFHPTADELWIVNQQDESVVIAGAAGTGAMDSWKLVDGDNQHHFLAQPSGLAFTDAGDWASIHETDERTQGAFGSPADFMGPTLWTGDSTIFDGGHFSHLDMLHNTPNGVGIAWEGTGNVFWVYDGAHLSLTRYDFKSDHDLGGTDHGDGVVRRFVAGEMGYEPTISSHLIVDTDLSLVYAADTANNRIVSLDPDTASSDGPYGPDYDGGSQTEMTGATLTTLVDGDAAGLELPSGIELQDGLIFVTDNATGFLHAFDKDGVEQDYVDLGMDPGALMGFGFDPRDGSIWLSDAANNEVVRLSLK